MNIKSQLSKAITLMVITLLFFSFKASYWQFDKKSREIVSSSIAKIFKSQNCGIAEIDDTFYTIKKDNAIVGYLAVTDAPSKFHTFDYYILFDNKAEILKVEILHYRENWGAEICSPKWLKQFIGIDTENSQAYNNGVDGISGATLSVNSLKYDLLKTCKALKLKL
jgi:hypothetical protein